MAWTLQGCCEVVASNHAFRVCGCWLLTLAPASAPYARYLSRPLFKIHLAFTSPRYAALRLLLDSVLARTSCRYRRIRN